MDYGAEYAALQALYETPDEDTLQTWGVDYVVFDGSALARFLTLMKIGMRKRFPVWYEDTGCTNPAKEPRGLKPPSWRGANTKHLQLAPHPT